MQGSPAPARTLIDVVKLSAEYLARHGSQSARLDAELLAAEALHVRRLDIYMQFDRPLDDDELTSIRELVRRRGSGEPVAYILGRREFYGRELAVTPDVLIPRPDTETLIEAVLAWCRDHSGATRILDVGTGSGCIAVTLAAELGEATVVATDVSAAALAVARRNAAAAGVDGRVEFREGPWSAPLAGSDVFDVIVSNPPYVLEAEVGGLARDVRDHEPRVALTDSGDGVQSYREIVAIATAHLTPGGLLAVEVDPRRAAAVAALAVTAWPGATAAVVADLAGNDRVVSAVRPGPAGESLSS